MYSAFELLLFKMSSSTAKALALAAGGGMPPWPLSSVNSLAAIILRSFGLASVLCPGTSVTRISSAIPGDGGEGRRRSDEYPVVSSGPTKPKRPYLPLEYSQVHIFPHGKFANRCR